MCPGTAHLGLTPHELVVLGDAPSFPSTVALAKVESILNFRLSTTNSPGFMLLRTPSHLLEKSPLCFHTLTNPFSLSSFLLIFIRIHRGCHPADKKIVELKLEPRIANSNATNRSTRGYHRCEVPGEARGMRPGSLCGRSPVEGSREGQTQRRFSTLAHPATLSVAVYL